MNQKRRARLYGVIVILVCTGIAVSLSLYALKENINLFYTPSQVIANETPKHRTFRLGGIVKQGSVKRNKDNLAVTFILSDTANEIKVTYNGILPDLFREGQGIVAQGKLNQRGQFIAQEVLAKHDENYMPPQLGEALKNIKHRKQS